MRWPLFALLLAACSTPEPGRVWLDERFEDPIELEQQWAITGSYHLASTIHPAEHALICDGPVTMAHSLGLTVYDDSSDGEWLEYSTDCDGDPELWNEAQLDGTLHVVAQLPASGAQVEWRRVHASIAPVAVGAVLSVLEVRSDAGGPCAIDNLRFMSP